MSFFDTINFLFYDKKSSELDGELLSNFSPYITTRYFSFYEKGEYTHYINDTLNTYGRIFKTNEETFMFYNNTIPKLRRKKINYIKRVKEVKEKTNEVPKAIPEFYSSRELEAMDKLLTKLEM